MGVKSGTSQPPKENSKIDRVQVRKLYGISIGGITGQRIGTSFISFLSVELGATYTQQSIVSSIQSLGNSILQSFWGSKSDQHGRKPYLTLGYGAFILGSLGFTLLWDINLFLIVLCIEMLLTSAIVPAWSGLLGDTAPERERGEFIGNVSSIGSFFSVVGVIITGFLLDYQRKSGPAQYHLAFYLAILCFVGVVVLILSLNETLHVETNRTIQEKPRIREILKEHRIFRRLLLINAIYRFVMMAPQFAFPFVIKDVVHATNTQISILFAANMLSAAVGERIGGKLSDRVGRKPILLFGRSLTFLVPLLVALCFLVSTWLLILVAFFFAGFNSGFGETMVNTIVLDIAPPLKRGNYVGIITMIAGIIGFIGSISYAAVTQVIATLLGDFTALFIMLLLASVLRFFAFLAHFTLPETSPKRRSE